MIITAKYTAGSFQARVDAPLHTKIQKEDIIRIKDKCCKCTCRHCWQTVQVNEIRKIKVGGKSYLLYFLEKL